MEEGLSRQINIRQRNKSGDGSVPSRVFEHQFHHVNSCWGHA
jgi:hypothetical protein